MSLINSESYKQGILVSVGFSFLAKLVGFANGIVVAYYFGTQTKTDVYVYAFATINLLVGYINALDQSVLIPEAMRIREKEGMVRSQEFLSTFLYFYIGIGLLAIIVFFINPVSTFAALSKFNTITLQKNVSILYLMIPLALLILIANLLVNILASFKYFTLPMIIGMINSCFSLLFIFLFHAKYDILSIGAGICMAYGINVAILFYILKFKIGWHFSLKLYPISRIVGINILYTFLGQVTSFFGTFLPFYLISGFSHGVVTAMNYGRNLAILPEQFITVQFSTVTGIKFNELFAKKANSEINTIFISTIRYLFFILIPISALMFLFSKEIITIIYKHGAFDANSVDVTSTFLKWFGLALPFTALNTIISRLYTCGQKIKESFGFGIGINLLYLLSLFVLVKKMGPIGYPISILIYLPISLFIIYRYFISKHYNFIVYDKIVINFLNIAFVNLIIAYFIYFCTFKVFKFENISLRILFGSAIYCALLIIINWFFCLEPIIKQQIKSIIVLIHKEMFNKVKVK